MPRTIYIKNAMFTALEQVGSVREQELGKNPLIKMVVGNSANKQTKIYWEQDIKENILASLPLIKNIESEPEILAILNIERLNRYSSALILKLEEESDTGLMTQAKNELKKEGCEFIYILSSSKQVRDARFMKQVNVENKEYNLHYREI